MPQFCCSKTRYLDRGLENSGLPRPHYEIPEDLVYRATSGTYELHCASKAFELRPFQCCGFVRCPLNSRFRVSQTMVLRCVRRGAIPQFPRQCYGTTTTNSLRTKPMSRSTSFCVRLEKSCSSTPSKKRTCQYECCLPTLYRGSMSTLIATQHARSYMPLAVRKLVSIFPALTFQKRQFFGTYRLVATNSMRKIGQI